MYCVNCGKEIGEGQLFCSECGARQNAHIERVEGQAKAMTTIPDHMVLSIISLFFFWPLGIVAVVFSSKVNSFALMGQYQLAREYSTKAKIFSWITIVIIAIIVFVIIVGVLVRHRSF